MPRNQEKIVRGVVVKQDFIKVGNRWKLVKQSKVNNAILNPKHWRDARNFDRSIGAKGTLSSGSIYNSRGRFDIMLSYTSISPDGKKKSFRQSNANTAYKTDEYL